jgi:hypothetical protein
VWCKILPRHKPKFIYLIYVGIQDYEIGGLYGMHGGCGSW